MKKMKKGEIEEQLLAAINMQSSRESAWTSRELYCRTDGSLGQVVKGCERLRHKGAVSFALEDGAYVHWRLEAAKASEQNAKPNTPLQLPDACRVHPSVIEDSRRASACAVARFSSECITALYPEGGGGMLDEVNLPARLAQLRADLEQHKKLAIDELERRHAVEMAHACLQQLAGAQSLEWQEKVDRAERGEFEALKNLEALRDKFRALDACYRGLFDGEEN
jgi:hypothetical protein